MKYFNNSTCGTDDYRSPVVRVVVLEPCQTILDGSTEKAPEEEWPEEPDSPDSTVGT